MKYAVSNWIYGEEPIVKTVKRLAKFGYDGIEIQGAPQKYEVKELEELFSSYNLMVSSICGLWPWDNSNPLNTNDLANPDEKVRRKAINYVKECLSFGSRLGAGCMVVVVGGCGKTMKLDDREWEYGVRSVSEAGKHAEDVGVIMAIEPINRYELSLMNNIEDGLRFISEVGKDGVKLMLDTFHMNIEETDPGAAIRRADEYLVHLHVADSNRQSVGRGHIDFKSIVKSLKEIDYNRFLVMEPLPPTASDVYDLSRLDSALNDLYAEECIEQLRFYERVT